MVARRFFSALQRIGTRLADSPKLVLSGLVGAMVVLGLLIAANNRNESEMRNRAQSEGDTLLAVNQLGVDLLDLETGQRGYILTRNPAYLRAYQAARSRVTPQFEAVRRAMMGSASRADQQSLRDFDDFLRSKLAEFDHTMALTRTGEFGAAAVIVQSNLGRRDMDAMRAQIAALSRNQAERRTAAFDAARKVDRNLIPMILLLWLLVVLFGWAAIVGERRRAAAQARGEQAEALRAANDRAQLLAKELDHRVKNLFTVVLAIIRMSQDAQTPPAEALGKITARIKALLAAHDAALSGGGVSSQLRDVAERVLAPYADGAAPRVRIGGPDVSLDKDRVTPIALILHELATNAAKYGALSLPEGVLDIAWELVDDPVGTRKVLLVWRESGGPPAAKNPHDKGGGFGTKMTDAASDQLGGSIVREWPSEGALVTLAFPQV